MAQSHVPALRTEIDLAALAIAHDEGSVDAVPGMSWPAHWERSLIRAAEAEQPQQAREQIEDRDVQPHGGQHVIGFATVDEAARDLARTGPSEQPMNPVSANTVGRAQPLLLSL